MRRLAALLAIVVLWSPLRATAQSQMPPVTPPVLEPGDSLRIVVWGRPQLSGSIVVAADSSLRHPLYQDVKVAGLQMEAVEQRVRRSLERFQESPQFVLEPTLLVSVSGEVGRPSLYGAGPEMTIPQLIALAGGVTDRGRLERVRLVRGGSSYRLDLTESRLPVQVLRVRSGDQIIVERRREVVREVITPVASAVGLASSVIGLLLYLQK